MKFLLILFIPCFSFSQSVLEGVVLNKTTKDKVPFASLSLIKAKVSVNTNENGVFKFSNYTSIPKDTLVVTCMGYSPISIPLTNVEKSSLKIELTEMTHHLKEVVVFNNNFKNKTTLNDFDQFNGPYWGGGGYTNQIAQHFIAPSPNAMLKNIKIARQSIPILLPLRTIFRLRFYAVDSATNAPTYDLTDKVIEVKSKSKIVKFDLEKYNIYLPNKDFFVAIEWLRIPYNLNIRKHKEKTEKYYTPSIGFYENSAQYMDIWVLGLNNVWHKHPSNFSSNLAIAVSIKY
jgi:hypothetical protein